MSDKQARWYRDSVNTHGLDPLVADFFSEILRNGTLESYRNANGPNPDKNVAYTHYLTRGDDLYILTTRFDSNDKDPEEESVFCVTITAQSEKVFERELKRAQDLFKKNSEAGKRILSGRNK